MCVCMQARESPEDDVLEFKEIRKGDPEWDEHVTQDPATGEAYFTPSDSLAVDKCAYPLSTLPSPHPSTPRPRSMLILIGFFYNTVVAACPM